MQCKLANFYLNALSWQILEIGNFRVLHAPTTHSGKHQAWLPIYHFEGLLEEVCPNHTCPVKHTLKDYVMTKNFTTSGSFTRDKGPKEDPSGRNAMPIPGEDVVMMVYDERPLWGGTACLT
jgi:hypothetical protein